MTAARIIFGAPLAAAGFWATVTQTGAGALGGLAWLIAGTAILLTAALDLLGEPR